MSQMDYKPETEIIAGTEQFYAMKAIEPDEEVTYNLFFDKVTVNFFMEEWEEFLEFAAEVVKIPLGTTGVIAETESYLASCEDVDGEVIYSIEMPGVTLFFFEDDWKEVVDLMKDLRK